MDDSRNTVHHDFHRDGNLLLDLLRRDSWPPRDNVDVVIRHIRICFYGKPVERNHSPGKQKDCDCQYQKAVFQGKVDEPANHRASSVASSWRTSDTTCWPGTTPERICWLFPGNMSPALTSTRLNCLSPAGIKTQSRSCKCKMAVEGTTAKACLFLLSNVAV